MPNDNHFDSRTCGRMRRRRCLPGAVVALVALALAACWPLGERVATTRVPLPATPFAVLTDVAPAEAATEGNIAVLLPAGPRWEEEDGPAFARCLDAADVEYAIVAAPDGASQQTQAQQAVAGGAKVLVLAHIDEESGAAVHKAARAAGIQVIDYERLTGGSPAADLYVSFDDFAAGRLIGEAMGPIVNALPTRRRNVALLLGPTGDTGAARLREGLLAVVQPSIDSGRWTLVADEAVAGGSDNAAAIMSRLLDETATEIGAVFTADDATAGAVIAAGQARGLEPILLSGQGAMLDSVRAILAGNQTMTVYRPVRLQAEAACQAAVAMLNGDDPTTFTTHTLSNGTEEVLFVRLRPIAVTRDTVAETVVADGVYSWEEICSGAYAALCPAE